MSTRAETALAQLAARSGGVIARKEATALGLTRHEVQGRIDAGVLVRVGAGVYRHAAMPDVGAVRLLSAVRSCGAGAVASHRSAAALLGLRDVHSVLPEVTVATRHRPRVDHVVVHRTDSLPAVDRAEHEGIPVTSVSRTLLDLGAVVRPALVEVVVQDALIRKLVAEADLLCILERLGGRGRRGTAALRAALRESLPAGIESQLELNLLRLVEQCPVPPPVLQWETAVAGRRVRFDLAWPDHRLAVEADGRRWHATRQDFERDLERRRAIAAAGWRHHPFGWTDVHERPDAVRRHITALFAAA